MRDGASGRSRGFGFLTFKDVKTVNIVMVKEHWLDGKIVSTFLALYFLRQGRCICWRLMYLACIVATSRFFLLDCDP